MSAVRKLIIFVSVIVLIISVIGIINSVNYYNQNVVPAQKAVDEACVDVKNSLVNLKASIDELTMSGYDTTAMLLDYQLRVDEFNEEC